MSDFAINTIEGIAAGSAYSLLALGFTLTFGTMRRLNIAFGPSIMVGVFAGAWVQVALGAGWLAAALACVIGTIVVSAYVERLAFAAIRRDAAVASMVATFAIWMQLEEAVALVFPWRTYAFPGFGALPPIEIGDLFLRLEHLVTLAVAGLAMIGLHLLVHRSHFGLELRTLADSPEAAAVAGVNVARVAFLTFVVAACIGGLAGFLIGASTGQITPKLGLWMTLKGLVAMVLGGLGSMRGAVLGGLLLGVVEAHAQWYLGAPGREMATYGLLFVALVLLPAGLAGGAQARSAAAATRRL